MRPTCAPARRHFHFQRAMANHYGRDICHPVLKYRLRARIKHGDRAKFYDAYFYGPSDVLTVLMVLPEGNAGGCLVI